MKTLAIRSMVAVAALTTFAVAAAPAKATLTPANARISATSIDSRFDAQDRSITEIRCPLAEFTGTINATGTAIVRRRRLPAHRAGEMQRQNRRRRSELRPRHLQNHTESSQLSHGHQCCIRSHHRRGDRRRTLLNHLPGSWAAHTQRRYADHQKMCNGRSLRTVIHRGLQRHRRDIHRRKSVKTGRFQRDLLNQHHQQS